MMLCRMAFGYLVRWLPCIWITALQKLICVIKVLQYLLFFPEWIARYWVWPTSTVFLLFQHTFLPISMWRPITCHAIGWFKSGIFFLILPKQLFTFGVYQRWICWHHPIPLNVSIITPWEHNNSVGLGVECLQPSLTVIENKFTFTLLNISKQYDWKVECPWWGLNLMPLTFWASTLPGRPQRQLSSHKSLIKVIQVWLPLQPSIF